MPNTPPGNCFSSAVRGTVIEAELLFWFADLTAVLAAASLTQPSARRTFLCQTERRGTPATIRTARMSWPPSWKTSWLRSWMTCCPRLQRSPLKSPPSLMGFQTKSALCGESRLRCLWANFVQMNTAVR